MRCCSGGPERNRCLWIQPILRVGIMKALSFVLIVLAGAPASGQALKTVAVESGRPEQTLRLPGEFLPFQAVELHARVNGFVESVNVDRGSQVKKGQLLVTLSA